MLLLFELRKLCTRRMTLAILALLFCLNGGLVLRQAYEPLEDGYSFNRLNVAAYYADHAGQSPVDVCAEIEAWKAQRYALYRLDEDGTLYLPTQEQVDAMVVYTSGISEEERFYDTVLSQVSQVADYDSYLEGIQNESARMAQASIFSRPGTFSYRNILRTSRAYAAREGTELTLGDSSAVKLTVENPVTTICLLFAAMLLGLNLLVSERELGLFALLKPTKRGGFPTVAAKLGAMAAALLALTLMFYSTNLAIGSALFELGELGRSIQSLDGYAASHLGLTVGEYLLLFLGAKYLAILAAGLLFFTICLFAKSHLPACLVAGGILMVELGLYWGIDLHSYLSPLRQVNFVSLLDTVRFFDNYRNMNLCGFPINTITVGLVTVMLLVFLPVWLSCLGWARTAPTAALRHHRQSTYGRISVNLFAHEAFKLFVTHRGALILALFLLVQIYSYHDIRVLFSESEHYYQEYCLVLTGELTQEKDDFVAGERQYFDSLWEQRNEIYARAGAGEISIGYADFLTSRLNPERGQQEGFERMERQWHYLKEQVDQGNAVRFVSDTGYSVLLDKGRDDVLDAGKLGFVLVVGLAALLPYEQTTNVIALIRPSVRGRRTVVARKLMAAGVFTLCAWLISAMPRLLAVLCVCELPHWDFPARSLEVFVNSPGFSSIAGWYTVLSALRLATALFAAGGTLLLAAKTKHTVTTVLVMLILLELPVALYLLGFSGEWGILSFQTGHILLS